MKLSYNDIFTRGQILKNIPNEFEGRKLKPSTITSLLLLRLAYQKKQDEFEALCQKALEELKKEEKYTDFDNKYAAIESARQTLENKKKVDAGETVEQCPTDDEVAKAEEVMNGADEFSEIIAELSNAYNDVRIKQSSVETNIEVKKLTRADLEDIVSVIGTEGKIKMKMLSGDFDYNRFEVLSLVTEFFVETA